MSKRKFPGRGRVRNQHTDQRCRPLADRFWSRVEKGPACWEWVGGRNADGYGEVRADGRMQKAHRVSWALAHGPIPPGMHVCHTCDNPPCVNPEHLFLGTNRANMRDRQAKGRTKNLDLGPRAHQAKTHCPKGHPYSGDNVRFRPNGRRRCAACYRERARRQRAVRREG